MTDAREVLVMLQRVGERMKVAGAALVALDEACGQCQRVLLPLLLTLAQHELDTGAPLADDAPVLTFSGNGTSDVVTAGQVRRVQEAMDQATAAVEALNNLAGTES